MRTGPNVTHERRRALVTDCPVGQYFNAAHWVGLVRGACEESTLISYSLWMSRVNTYLNFMGTAEEAFTFYKGVFDSDYVSPIVRFADMPFGDDGPHVTPDELQKIMHIELPIINGHVLMASDMLPSLGHEIRVGNNTTISLELDSRDEAQRLYDELSQGASDATGMNDMPWGAYWGCCLDRFSIRWMISTTRD